MDKFKELKDEFAMVALEGLIAFPGRAYDAKALAEASYKIANEMMSHRKLLDAPPKDEEIPF